MQQEIFSRLKVGLEAMGYDVYDGHLPPEGTSYPFIYLGTTESEYTPTKGESLGNVYMITHVYHNDCEQRGRLSRILQEIRREYARIEVYASRPLIMGTLTERIMEDNTTDEPLLHGVSEIEFKVG